MLAFGSALALTGGVLARWLRDHASFARLQQKVFGGALVALALRLATK